MRFAMFGVRPPALFATVSNFCRSSGLLMSGSRKYASTYWKW